MLMNNEAGKQKVYKKREKNQVSLSELDKPG
jgi:hypothetical protein